MIAVRVGDLASVAATAVLRPVSADWTAVTPAMRRLELAAGPAVEEQCRRLGELPVGSAAITAGGELPADYIVHVVVRSRDEPVTKDAVRRGLLNGLRRLSEWAIESVALAPLGTGAGNLDPEDAADVMVPVLLEQLREARRPLEVALIVENEYEREAFERALHAHARPGGPDAGAPDGRAEDGGAPSPPELSPPTSPAPGEARGGAEPPRN